MTKDPFVIAPDHETVWVGREQFRDGSAVRVLFAGQWYPGELQLWRSPACVWVEALGHVALADEDGHPCQVDALAASKHPRRPAA